jgi:hypothetical protein
MHPAQWKKSLAITENAKPSKIPVLVLPSDLSEKKSLNWDG